MTVREYLTEYNKQCGFGTGDDELIETLVYVGHQVKVLSHESFRWYVIETVITQVGDEFIKYDDYIITGDDNMYDMGLEYNIDEAKMMERKERIITEVYYDERT